MDFMTLIYIKMGTFWKKLGLPSFKFVIKKNKTSNSDTEIKMGENKKNLLKPLKGSEVIFT